METIAGTERLLIVCINIIKLFRWIDVKAVLRIDFTFKSINFKNSAKETPSKSNNHMTPLFGDHLLVHFDIKTPKFPDKFTQK